jgi:murein DD-endopeptidase MepM/ murein hydrolase activator NlpD
MSSRVSILVLAALFLLPWSSLNPPVHLRENETETAATEAFPPASMVTPETALAANEPAASAPLPADQEAPAAAEDLPKEITAERVLVMRRGDTVAGLLDDADIEKPDAFAAVEQLGRYVRLVQLRPGNEIAIRFTTGKPSVLLEVEIEPEPGRLIRAFREETGDWTAEEILVPRDHYLVRAEGKVDGGLFPAMIGADIPPGMAMSIIRMLGHQLDFQRDLMPGDRFKILYERVRANNGEILGHGQTLRVTLHLSGRKLDIWSHTNRLGETDWYDDQGRTLRRSLLRTPLDGARVSSGFGARKHPILGYDRMHTGVDFAAPTGTAVFAAADGVVISAKNEGGYGLIVRIRHANGLETRYAHLSRFGRNIVAGRRVVQGSVIGHVGSTGMSTGPHLHYEVVVNGRAVNPSSHVQPSVRLAGSELSAFRNRQRRLEALVAMLATNNELALASD